MPEDNEKCILHSGMEAAMAGITREIANMRQDIYVQVSAMREDSKQDKAFLQKTVLYLLAAVLMLSGAAGALQVLGIRLGG
jgi:hypothetical protein